MTVNHFKQTLKYGEHHSIILMQLLIISSLKRISQYVLYREASIAIPIVSWGECIFAALSSTYQSFLQPLTLSKLFGLPILLENQNVATGWLSLKMFS